MGDVVVLASPPRDPIRSKHHKWRCLREMHTCGTSTSPPSSVQQVWWRDGLDLQHDGVVYMVENFCCRASPTNSREGERRAAGRLGLEGKVCGWGEGAHQPSIYRGGGGQPFPILQAYL